MFVTVIHRIHDPEGSRAAEGKALAAGLPFAADTEYDEMEVDGLAPRLRS